MIQFLRNMFSSKIGVLLALAFIVLIALAFGLSSINAPSGMFSGGNGDDIATVGDQEMGEDQVYRMATRALSAAREQSPGVDMQAFINEGGLDEIIEQNSRALALGAFGDANGINFGKRLIDAAIASTPAFQGLSGQFDENTFRQVLQQQSLTEQEVREQLRQQRLFRLVLGPISAGARLSDSAVRPYAELLFERRKGQVIAVPSAAMGEGDAPTDADITSYYRSHIDRYTLPERRAVRYATFTRDQLNVAAPTAEQIQNYYDEHQDQYAGSEQRELHQIILPSQEAAQAFYREVKGGTDFTTAANQRGFSNSSTQVEADSRQTFANQTSDAVAAAAFAAPQGGLTEPARSDFGWHVIRVDSIRQRAGKSLASVRGDIAETLQSQLADQALADFYETIQSAIDDGSSLTEVAQQNGLTVTATPPLAPNGQSPDNPEYSAPPEIGPILEGAFSMGANEDPIVVPVEENQRYAIIDVTEVKPSAPQPLARIKPGVSRDFIVDRAARRAQQVANQIAQRINDGKSVSEAVSAADVSLPPAQQINTTRQAMSQAQNVPAPLQLLFRMAEGTAKLVQLPQNQGWFVVVLEDIDTDADQVTDEILAGTAGQFGQVISSEYIEQFISAVMRDYPVERNEEAIQTLQNRLLGRTQ